MKKINKIIVAFLILSSILTFTACSNNNENSKGDLETESSVLSTSDKDGSVSDNNSSSEITDSSTEILSSEVNSESEHSENNNNSYDENDMYVLDLEVEPSTTPGIIIAVFTVNNLRCNLLSVEFFVTYTSNTVEGVYTTYEEMNETMTKVPMYESTAGVMLPKFEQICTYKKASSLYECRYIDLLSYPMAVSGTECEGLTSEGQLVITIPFKVNSDAKAGDVVKFDYIEGSVKGTNLDYKSVSGYGYAVTYTLTENDIAK